MNKIESIMKSKLFLIFVCFILIKPGIFSEYSNWNIYGNIINFFRIILTLLNVFIFYKKRMKFDKSYLIMLYYIVLLISTFINGGDYFTIIVQAFLTLNWIIIFSYNIKYNKNNFLDALEITFMILVFINFITIIIFPEGIYTNSAAYDTNYFLGYDNNLIMFILPAITVSFMNSYRKYNKLSNTTIILYFISLFSIIRVWSVTSVIAFIIFTFLLIVFSLIKKKKYKLIKFLSIIILLFTLLLIIFKSTNLYEYLIVNVLKKDITFSGRTKIWVKCWEYIKIKPLLGYGNESIELLLLKINARHAHNIYLNLLYQGGVILFFVFLIILWNFKPKRNTMDKKVAVIYASVIAFLIAFFFEAYPVLPMFFIVLLLSFYIKSFDYELSVNNNILKNRSFYFLIKRLFDILVSFIGCFCLILITPIIKLFYILNGDYYSIFYTQTRIGKNGKYFKLYKYRTMVIDADNVLEEILKDKDMKKEWSSNQKLKNDPRVTKIGKYLRNSCVDEIPQFINILKGDMSLIGPRPYLVREKNILKSNLSKIVVVKPGITGYWQVNRDENITFNSRIKCEKYYAENCNLWLDIKIFFKTILMFFKK